MKVLDLFAGIGGFSLAAHWLGWETVAFVEKDAFCQKVLAKNFKDIPIYGDITEFSGKPFRGQCDIITGGFPCQPFSIAGQQKGTSDERHLFPEMLRVVEEIRPRYVVAENVRGLLGVESGKTFEEICSSLEHLDYSVQSFIIPACAINAPHCRDRVWVIAHTDRIGRDDEQKESCKTLQNEKRLVQTSEQIRSIEQCGIIEYDSVFTNADSARLQRRLPENGVKRAQSDDEQSFGCGGNWNESWFEVATALCRVDDGISRQLDRTNRLKALGNSIVPQIAYEIFKAIEESENIFSI